jgi:hypothetical protein
VIRAGSGGDISAAAPAAALRPDVLALIRKTNYLISGRELNDHGEYDRRAFLLAERRRETERVRTASRRLWAAMLLPGRVDELVSILRRLPVRAGGLDAVVLRHALRGAPLPPADTYMPVTDEMLDAIAEAESVIAAKANEQWKEQQRWKR